MSDPVRMAAVGLDHRHIYGQCAHMIDAGAELVCYWTQGTPGTLPGLRNVSPTVRG